MRVRIRHTKMGKVRFTSHRDTARHWERALRKATFRVATSGGFTPRPRMSFGLALPTGAESVAEYLDVEFAEDIDLADPRTMARMTEALPVGYQVTALGSGGPASLQEEVVACTWWVGLSDQVSAAAPAATSRLLAAASLPIERERKGQRRTDDARPAIEELAFVADSDRWGGGGLTVTLATLERGLRPGELLQLAFPDADPFDAASRIVRTHQWIERDGCRRDVLPVSSAGPAQVAVA